MSQSSTFDKAVGVLKEINSRVQPGDSWDPDLAKLISARNEVVPRYQRVFSAKNIPNLSEEEFRNFLMFRNNRHWLSLQRMGPSICEDMDRLRSALEILLDEQRPIAERLNYLVPQSGAAFVPRLHKAVLTPILLIAYPDRYGVWNQLSENAMKALDLWPDFERGMPFGERYVRVNAILNQVEEAVGVDLWTLDALWWRATVVVEDHVAAESEVGLDEEAPEAQAEGARFGLERHLQEFLRDNWEHTDLGKDWVLYQEDGDPEAGFEYPCGIGRIDLLARHQRDAKWLVIELKRQQSSDQTVGQVLRYMGWVQDQMAAPDESVEGLVIAHQGDESIRYALKVVPNVELNLYEVDFHLRATET